VAIIATCLTDYMENIFAEKSCETHVYNTTLFYCMTLC